METTEQHDRAREHQAPAEESERRERPQLDGTLAAILAHPLRCKIHTILHMRTASPAQVSRALELSLGIVSYHFRCLRELGVIELVDEKPRRGSTEHHYRAIVRPEVSDEEFAQLTISERQDVGREVLQLLCADAGSSLDENLFGARPDNYILRHPGFVDEKGWKELGDVMDVAKDGIDSVYAAVLARRAKDPTIPAFSVSTGLTFFESPLYELLDSD